MPDRISAVARHGLRDMENAAQIVHGQTTGWLGSPLVEVAGTQLTAFMLVRTMLIVVLVWVAVRLVRRSLDRASNERPEITRSGAWVLGKLAKWLLLLVGAYLVLTSLGIDLTRATLIMSALTVGIGFGLQNIVNNFVSGIILMFERSVRVGDWVEVGTTRGIVKQMNIRSTIVSTFDRAEVIVPNSDLISGHVTNWTLLDSTGRIVVTFEVVPGPDPDQVCELLVDCARQHEIVCKGPEPAGPVARVSDIGVRGIAFTLQCFVADVMTSSRVRGELITSVTRRFSDEGIDLALASRASPVTD